MDTIIISLSLKMPCEVAEYFISDRMEQPVHE